LKERALTDRSRGSDSLPHLSLLQRKLQAVKQMNMETDRKPVPLGKFRFSNLSESVKIFSIVQRNCILKTSRV
jgi:hypothetical protein